MTTNNLVSAIKAGLVSQDRVTALENCHRGWDGNIDADTIRGGISDRLKAMGKEYMARHGILIQRKDLKTVVVKVKGDHFTHKVFEVNGGEVKVHAWAENFFHPHELEEMGEWLQKNCHHL